MIDHDTEHLKTNKQFMLGNGLLAFAVFIIVALFFYLSFREQSHMPSPWSRALQVMICRCW